MSERTVGIVGLGLIGGSLARGLREAPDPPRIVASSLDSADLERAVAEGVLDSATEDAGAVAGSVDIVVYATPLDATLELLEAHRERFRSGTVLTDVVSLKVPLARKVRELGLGDRWIGGHPMAGSERSGFDAARGDLFRDASVFLVRGEGGKGAATEVSDLWTRVGGRVRWVEAEEHDRLMIRTSHLPQLVANALAATLAEAGVTPGDLGPGGRDMTRLAASAPGLWKGLVRVAGSREVESLREVIGELEHLAELLARGDVDQVETYMERTRTWREGGAWS